MTRPSCSPNVVFSTTKRTTTATSSHAKAPRRKELHFLDRMNRIDGMEGGRIGRLASRVVDQGNAMPWKAGVSREDTKNCNRQKRTTVALKLITWTKSSRDDGLEFGHALRLLQNLGELLYQVSDAIEVYFPPPAQKKPF